jgi:hypothetical protein
MSVVTAARRDLDSLREYVAGMEDVIALLAMGLALEVSETYFALATTPTRHHYQIEGWISHNTLERMLDWCRRSVADEYDYQTYTEPLLGEHAIAVRFYFTNPVDAAAFEDSWRRQY